MNNTRMVLNVEYDGSGFFGWQRQIEQRSVQGELERALSVIANQPITVQCAGRTDTGVHALEQIVHFDTPVERDPYCWLRGTNSHLPDDVRVLWVQHAIGDFHARYSAIARFYRYVIFNRNTKSAILKQQATWCATPLNEEKMHIAAQSLLGRHDFSSFRAQACQSKSPFRHVYFVDVYRDGDRVIIDIAANAFLHHMVRNIAGVLMAIGSGKQPIEWTQALLNVKSRVLGGVTAPPDGLYLAGVFYPEHYGIAKHKIFNRLPVDAKRFD